MANEGAPAKKPATAKPTVKATPVKAEASAKSAPMKPKPAAKAAKPATPKRNTPVAAPKAPSVEPVETPAPTKVEAIKPRRPATRKPSAPRKITGDSPMAAAKKDATQETLETVTAASNEAFKEGFEKSLSAVNEFSAFQKDTVDAVIASATTASKSIEELNSSAIAFAKKSMEDGVAAAKTMAGAKSVQELIEIQADFTKSSLDAYLSEVNKSSDLISSLMKESFKPLNDRMVAAVETLQSQR